jgi:hypothetical protein
MLARERALFGQGGLRVELSERLARLEAIVAAGDPLARDLEVIRLQLIRAQGKVQGIETDVIDTDASSELRIVEERLARAEKRLSRALAGLGPGE